MMSCGEAVIHTTTDTDSEQCLFFVFSKKKKSMIISVLAANTMFKHVPVFLKPMAR